MTDPPIIWQPFPKQELFLASPAYEVLFGGAASPGKTDAMIVAPLRWVHHPRFNGIIFRRTFPELEGQVIPKSRELYPYAGGVYNGGTHTWTFPSGARINFGYLGNEADILRYQGLEFSFIGFDELTQFTKKQYTYLLTRARSAHGLPIRIRSTSNPGGPGHEWVLERFAPWLRVGDSSYDGVTAKPCEVLYFSQRNADTEYVCNEVDPGAASRVFIPATIADNPRVMQNDPGYWDRLSAQDPVTRAQLRDGNWLVKPAAGLYFKRQWFRFLDLPPVGYIRRVRAWDLASVENGGDWTVGVRMAKHPDGRIVIEDVIRGRWSSDGVEKTLRATAEMDGKATRIRLPQDPGQAGKAQVKTLSLLLAGYECRFAPVTGDKKTRAAALSAQCEAGNVSVVKAGWNEPFMQCLEAFPEPNMHDDDVDAAADAYNDLVSTVDAKYDDAIPGAIRRNAVVMDDDDDFDDDVAVARRM